jgi:acetolactate synthase I/II/III large subunit
VNGAEAILKTLVRGGVDICFANAGTTEMHLVSALDRVPELRVVPVLFEGVATGAADGYARMRGLPAATMLHLGPGLANGLANLHNARRARSPLVNLVGDHPAAHLAFDPPLASDIESVARTVSAWYRVAGAATAAGDTAEAVAAAAGPPAQIATIVIPADVAWTEGAEPGSSPRRHAQPQQDDGTAFDTAVRALRGGPETALLLGGGATRRRGLCAAARIAAHSGTRVFTETFPARAERGRGLPEFERLAYLGEMSRAQLAGVRHLVAVDTPAPATFFAYPGSPGTVVEDGCEVTVLAPPGGDAGALLEQLAGAAGAPEATRLETAEGVAKPSGELTAMSVAQAIGALLPEGAIVSDESITSGLMLPMMTASSPPHDWLCLTGGSIGQGLPVAAGAAMASPGRRVIALEADGSAMYTVQSLWTMARENLDVTTVIYSNRSYAILNLELERIAADVSESGHRLFDLTGPALDFCALATGMGMAATRATTADEFVVQLERSLATPGPSLIEAVI